MDSFIDALKKRKKAQEDVGSTTASDESVEKSQEAAKDFEKVITGEKKRRKQNENSKDGYSY